MSDLVEALRLEGDRRVSEKEMTFGNSKSREDRIADDLCYQAASRISQQDAELERVRRELEEAKADKARLDFLDECNKRLNTHHGTNYGWEMVMNHNVNRLMTGHLAVDLNDAKAHGFKSCRGAIDEEMKRIEVARALRAKAEETRT